MKIVIYNKKKDINETVFKGLFLSSSRKGVKHSAKLSIAEDEEEEENFVNTTRALTNFLALAL